jgi:hypothetical protein
MMSRGLPRAIAAATFAVMVLGGAATASAAPAKSTVSHQSGLAAVVAFKLAHPCDGMMHGM